MDMENDVRDDFHMSNYMQVIPHSDRKEGQEKGINGIPGEEQQRSTRLQASNQLSIKSSVNRRFFRCSDCDKIFTCIKDMCDHSEVCTNRQGPCILCKKTFKSCHDLTIHMKVCATRVKEGSIELPNHQIPVLIKCAICSASYISEDAFLDHMSSYHGTHERMTTPKNRSVHYIECTYPKCEFKAPSDIILQAHVDAYHLKKHRQISIKHRGVKPVLPYKCQYCDASFVVESILKRHIKSHGKRSKKEISIGSCKKILKHKEGIQKDSLVGCIQEADSIVNKVQVVFQCEYCGKTISGANELANHLKKHSEKKKLKYKMQREQCTSSHNYVLTNPQIKKVRSAREVDSDIIYGDDNGKGEISAQEVERIASPKKDKKDCYNMLALKHDQEQIGPEVENKEFLDTVNMILSDDDDDDDDEYDNINPAVNEDNSVKNWVLMKCDFCSAAFVSENYLKKHLQRHKNKENKLKKYGWFGWELRSNTDVGQDHSMPNSLDEVQNLCSRQKATSRINTSEEYTPQKVYEIKCEKANESSVFENVSVPKTYIGNPMNNLYLPEVKEENCSIGDYCMTDSKEMVKIDIKEEFEVEKLDILKEELE